jgi:hypothetical protein
MYITKTVKGYRISGNRRRIVKKYIKNNYPDLFDSEHCWNLTLTQILVGLIPDQARCLAKADNEKEKIQSANTLSSAMKTFNKSYGQND